ncbi:hypothetical protein AALA44_08405 [Enterococcus ratti]|uniref:hypothetical protein n=1 Tax=Enterococcus ratti TaxID=150033 RepID=UPI003512293F
MSEKDFFNYLTLALKNLGSSKALIYNIENEIRRLMKVYSTEELANKIESLK